MQHHSNRTLTTLLDVLIEHKICLHVLKDMNIISQMNMALQETSEFGDYLF